MNRQANASEKSKEVQPTAQSQRFAPHLIFHPTHQQNPTSSIVKASNILMQ